MLHAHISKGSEADGQRKGAPGPAGRSRQFPSMLGNQAILRMQLGGALPTVPRTSRTAVLHRKCACGASAGASGQCAECRDKDVTTFQPRAADRAPPQPVPPIVHEVLRTPGEPLETGVRDFMEPRFGRDLGRVRVHDDGKAAESALATRAVAYTVGEHMVFRHGAYDPASTPGRRLIAHELTHVLQQQGGLHPLAEPHGEPVRAATTSVDREPPGRPETVQAKLEIGAPDDAYEQQADRIADRIMTTPLFSTGGGAAARNSTAARSDEPGMTALQRLSYSPAFDASADSGVQPEEEIGSAGGAAEAVQQKSTEVLQRVPMRDDGELEPDRERVRSRGGDLPYKEATELLECIRIMGEDNAESCREQVLGEKPQPIIPCDPLQALTWADFQGTPPRSSFAAETQFHFDLRSTRGQPMIWAIFDGATSWVKPGIANPGNQTATGCARNITACETFFARNATATSFSSRAPRGCAAATAHFVVATATNSGECTTVLGTACDTFSQDESDRVLNHEQFHFNLACALAQKGTLALGTSATANQRILAAVRRKANTLTARYDNQTLHGCNPARQAAWEADINSGLPNETIP